MVCYQSILVHPYKIHKMKPSNNGKITDPGFLSSGNMAYLESLYQESSGGASPGADSDGLEQWKSIFAALPEITLAGNQGQAGGSIEWQKTAAHKQASVAKLIMAYRSLGHLLANVDPIGVMPRGDAREIQLDQYDLSEADLDTEYDVGGMANGGRRTLRDILEFLHDVYCRSIGL